MDVNKLELICKGIEHPPAHSCYVQQVILTGTQLSSNSHDVIAYTKATNCTKAVLKTIMYLFHLYTAYEGCNQPIYMSIATYSGCL